MFEFYFQDAVEKNNSFGDKDYSEEIEEYLAGLRFKVVFNWPRKQSFFWYLGACKI